jgi:hypothetical protein
LGFIAEVCLVMNRTYTQVGIEGISPFRVSNKNFVQVFNYRTSKPRLQKGLGNFILYLDNIFTRI